MRITNQLGFAFILIFALTSCSKKDVLMSNINDKWAKSDVKTFDFTLQDYQLAKNIGIVVRNNNNYKYSNLRLIATLEKDKETISTDTLNFVLAKPNGEWLGSGFGDVKENQFQYKVDYKFPSDGSYSIKIQQAMRQNVLVGIEDLGIKIQDIKP